MRQDETLNSAARVSFMENARQSFKSEDKKDRNERKRNKYYRVIDIGK
jgi:hypothetical protein